MTYHIHGRWNHSKAAEEHINVTFDYPGRAGWKIAFPIKCRRAGLDLDDDEAIEAYVAEMYALLHPDRWQAWQEEAEAFWANSKADVTKPIFDAMARNFDWLTYPELSKSTNPARRIQDIKEFGFTIGIRPRGRRELEYILLPKPRAAATGYEYWSGQLRARILRVLGNIDVYEGKPGNPKALLPDHKFPEIRWDRDTRRESLEDMTDQEIRRDFQLLTNQRNQQKREVCRRCMETGERGYPFGLRYYYAGGPAWPDGVPVRGKAAEPGCIGCGWYDFATWRQRLLGAIDKA